MAPAPVFPCGIIPDVMDRVVDVFIPTYNPGKRLLQILEMLQKQTVQIRKVRIINTEKEGFDAMLEQNGMTQEELIARFPFLSISHIGSQEFDHGGTRNLGFSLCEGADYVLTMTQDALPADSFLIEKLLAPMEEENKSRTVAVSFARQLPNANAQVEEKLSREFNYPEKSRIKSLDDLSELGIKTYFCSNVCALYRMDIFRKVSGFPGRAIFNEDMIYASRAMKAGCQVSYTADALVYHSHSYTASQQFHRNFDIGVSQAQNPDVFGGISSESEGVSYVRAVLSQMKKEHELHNAPSFIVRCFCRFVGYRLGKKYEKLPRKWVIFCSSNRHYWDEDKAPDR